MVLLVLQKRNKMLQKIDHIEIPIEGKTGFVTLYIYPQSPNAQIYEDDIVHNGLAKYHLTEGSTYTYECFNNQNQDFQLRVIDNIVAHHRSARHKREGTITTGIYVGTLKLCVYDIRTCEDYGFINVEVRSTKSNYESDYRQMLEDIAEYYTDLVLQQGSPISQKLEIKFDSTSNTLYQRFSFIKSIIESETFSEAVQKIISNPIKKWTDTNIECNIIKVKRFSRKNIRQIASKGNRIDLPVNIQNSLYENLTSVPRYIEMEYKKDTIDNQENQFVKFVLHAFLIFCSELKEMKNATERLKAEAELAIETLETFLDNQFFRQISMPTFLNQNSPVLQKKEGYREVFQYWLLFDLAAKLNWIGGDDVYDAGKKNVATLYEYWLFFKLIELIEQFFNINPKDKERLVNYDSDKINLNITQGRMQVVSGRQETFSRLLNVAFYYNRTFTKVAETDDSIHNAGSWTMSMRPDYTLSLWPGDISEDEAEKQDLITHIHFDAKYRLNSILLNDSNCIETALDEEKQEQELKIYKRGDLLKMHAYKDAIRRTSGAYVLYPGVENKILKGYHEIVPGLGAFSIRPGHWDEDSIALKQFISEIKAHMLDRTSTREKLSYYHHLLYNKDESSTMVMEKMPESVYENRDFIPDEVYVIVAYYKSQEHLNWILQNHMYNMRAGDSKGAISLDDKLINARYILLHNGQTSYHLIKIVKKGPKVYTRSQLILKGYPQYMIPGTDLVDIEREQKESDRIYLVFELFKTNSAEKELLEYSWVNLGRTFAYTIDLVSLISKAYKKSI